MFLSIVLLLITPFLADVAQAYVAREHISTTCPIGKICPWGWGEIYTIYESQPNSSFPRQYNNGIYFEASQKVGHDDGRGDKTGAGSISPSSSLSQSDSKPEID